jgi:uncharacterized protein (TIGR03435 family)
MMKKFLMLALVLSALVCGVARAQDVVGDWQGALDLGGGHLRMVVKVTKADKGGLGAKLYNADRGTPPMNASSVALNGTSFKFSVEQMSVVYEGKLSADGKTIAGAWTQGGTPAPLTLVRATKETAWDIPEPPAPPKPMAADANPGFEVATIKPNDSGEANLRQLTMNGRNFVLKNGSFDDLIGFAYNVQKKQIMNGPDWVDKDRYDIAGVPDVEGNPNVDQLRMMIQKLLADRFKVTFHHEKRELSAFVLRTEKTGQKLIASDSTDTRPNVGFRGVPSGVTMVVTNATVGELTSVLAMMVLDRPVVDQTGVTGKYDLSVTFMPDGSQFNGRPPRQSAADGVEAAPDLYQAIEKQLGMKLTQEKAPVDVLVIDHVEKPSAN